MSNIIKLQSLKRLIRFFISIHPPNNVLVQQVEKLSYDENYSVRSNAIKSFETELKYEPRHEKTNVLVSHTSNTNQALQLHKMARGLKFWIRKEEELYYLCSENKGADQLRGNRKADLRLCFRICKTLVFS